MKYLLLLILLLPININSKTLLDKCVDGDTASFNINGEIKTVRFLAIDTPESTNKKEYYGKEASDYTCNYLKNANNIKLELDANSDEYDRYNRLLAWVFVDDKLLQNEIIKNGYGKVAYIYGDYKYTDILYESENYAKSNKIGIWNDYESHDYLYYIILIFVILGSLFLSRKQKQNIKKVLNFIKKI